MRRPRNSGYALLLVLVTLTICAVALTGLATRGLQANLDSLERLRGLQTRWGRLSCSRALLSQAPSLFDALEQQAPAGPSMSKQIFPAALKETIGLGGQSFTIILADENAKLNLNSVHQLGRPNSVTQALRQLLGPQHFAAVRDLNRRPPTRSMESWGDVFDLHRLRQLPGSERGLAEITRSITLWGTGKLNIHRASEKSLELACKAIVTDGLARRLVERNVESKLQSDLLLQQTVLNDSDRGSLELLLGDGSSAFSVWIESVDGNLRTQHFSVIYTDQAGIRASASFSLN